MPTRKVDAAWMHCTEVIEGDKTKVKCNYCPKVVGSITRLKEHLAIVGTDVTGCPNVDSEVSEQMRNNLVKFQRKDGEGPRGACNQRTTGHWPPSNVAMTNAYIVRPGYQLVPIAFQARPTQIAYPSPPVTPSIASGSGYGVWGGHQSAPLNEIQCHVDSAAWGQGFQLTLHSTQTQLQNQLGMEAHQQPQMGPELQLLPLSDMSDTGTSSFEQQLPLAHRSDINLELQLGTKPRSPDEAR